MPFSTKHREAVLQDMSKEPLDLLVIGGGITGAGIALDAAQRGLKVGLVEKNDFGSGTSSRSTKLIHGGLRYLKQGDVKLVRDVGRERAILYKNAPHLVIPAPMLLPVYKGGTYGYMMSSIGLYVYDWLAGVARKERRKMLGREAVMKQEPMLRKEGLKGGGVYYEYRTDDARLTLDIMKTAVGLGAKAVNYAEVERILYRDGIADGLEVRDRVSGQATEIYAKHIVNAAGPWADQLRKLDGSLQGKRLFLTKGVHLVVDYKKLPVKQAAYFDTPDGRMVFVIPRGHITYIGTTDTVYGLSIDKPTATVEDRSYLIRAVNAMFPSVGLTEADIQSHWAGLRPLIYEEGKGPSELSRKDEIFVSPSGLITIAGGKLTGFRLMAEKIVDLVAGKIAAATGSAYPSCRTDKVVVSGGERLQGDTYAEWKKLMVKDGAAKGLDAQTAQEWVDLYGTNTLRIYERYERLKQEGYSPADRTLCAQLLYSIEEEMTVSVLDFLRLRTGWTYFRLKQAELQAESVVRLMGELLGWDQPERDRQSQQVQQFFQDNRDLPLNDKVEQSS